MTKSIQEIFNRLQEKKKQVSVIRKKYKEELATSAEYGRIREDLERLRTKKKQYELATKQQAGANFARVDELALAVRQDAQLLSDVALTSIMKGERVEIKDDHSEYEPIFTVRFKRIK
jgi:hypothetical protein